MTLEHGHSLEEVRERLGTANGSSGLRDAVYGGIDGAVTTFAIVAGVGGAGLSNTIIIVLGIANVLADGFSMAAGNFSGIKAERDDMERLRAVEKRHIETTPEGERLELREILRQKGLSGSVLDDAVKAIARNKSAWINLMLVEEYGVSPVLPNPLRAALITFVAFVAAGMVPLIPFLAGLPNPFTVSLVATMGAFFVIGALKSRWSLTSWWWSGLESLSIGAIAASIAYGVGVWIEQLM